MNTQKRLSIIVPARNEKAQIGETVQAILASIAHFEGKPAHTLHLDQSQAELFVVINGSTDGTLETLTDWRKRHGIVCLESKAYNAPAARNHGVREATGSILVFVDADTRIPTTALARVIDHVRAGSGAGIFRLASQEPGLRAFCFWTFWEYVRMLPIARAKAMPAFMFCTRDVFDTYGPFDEEVKIGEEWPILAGLYSQDRQRVVYDRSITAKTSSRRMELRRFGYSRLLARYVWAILHKSGRLEYTDTVRHSGGT